MPGPKNVLVDIWLLSSVATALVAEELADSPLSVDEFALYGLVSDLGPVTATQLSQWTGMSPTTLSAMLRRCQARGELARTPNAADRRSTLVELTEQGRAVYGAALPALAVAQQRLAEHLDLPDDDARATLQRVDAATRAALRLPPRPYRVSAPPVTGGLPAGTAGLTADQEAEVRAFAAWLRYRDAAG
ncbi:MULTISPECIES: MarR family winged helix-turn-helix transcriptional regulator [unclassified Actinoplanes]|uniref:MarR family winged helix-turn-helix transcriptional regulator n=1 Tax=unclassified Actinoplanes TaxID=2626549 RepID=UPI0002E77CD7|nr:MULTISPECIES: MarR family winged helix-turn-helix transcriptional regulator [unclassified Actinoplanes]